MAVLVFSFLFMVRPFLWLMDLIINHFFTTITVLKFFILSLFEVSPDIVALSFLSAILGTIGRMNMENEYRIFLISGIPAKQIFRQFLLFAGIFVVMVFVLSFFVVPSASYSKKLLLTKARMDEPIKIFRSRKLIKEFPGITIYVDRIDRTNLDNISIVFREGSKRVCRIQAKTGKIAFDSKGCVYLLLKNGRIETYSIKNGLIYRVMFDVYYFSLPYQTTVTFPPLRRLKEMTLPLLIEKLYYVRGNESREIILLFVKKIFFTLLPLFYLFFGFYAGIGIKVTGYFQVVGTGLTLGLLSYFIILLGEAIAYKSGNVFSFLIAPTIFVISTFLFKRNFSNVT
ncbi:MAG: LptF/LptG family permease [Candidatus Omnitrophica bacterium]|nr:LptF/LptG family permease [Candidatus Omnitrophota bacterium]